MFTGKRVFIYGTGRFQMDFECVFDDLQVEAYLSYDKALTRHNGKPVYFFKDFAPSSQELDSLVVIVCDFESDQILYELVGKGFSRGKTCYYAEELFVMLDRFQVDFSTTPVALWGTGNASKEFLDYYSDNWGKGMDVRYYLDNDASKQERGHLGKAVHHPASMSVDELKKVFIIVTTSFYGEIKNQLEAMGLIEFEHFVFCSYVLARPSRMLAKVIRATPRPGPECAHAFSRLIVAMQGVFCCVCSPFVTLPLGNAIVQSCDDIWQSPAAKIFRLSIINHTYCFCKLSFCNEKTMDKPVRERYGRAEIAPTSTLRAVEFSFDCTCNLHCESCRDVAIHGNAGKIHFQIADSLLKSPLINTAEECQCCGGGEVFAGKGFERLLFSEQAPRRKKGIIQTNLQLFNERNWQKVRDHFEKIRFTVSMDGAVPETFERIRRGARFDIMIRNLELLSDLKNRGEVESISITMVIQRKNYREMPAMLELAGQLGVDFVSFVKIMNWGSYSDEQYRNEISMFDYDNVTMRPELREIVNTILNSKYETRPVILWQI